MLEFLNSIFKNDDDENSTSNEEKLLSFVTSDSEDGKFLLSIIVKYAFVQGIVLDVEVTDENNDSKVLETLSLYIHENIMAEDFMLYTFAVMNSYISIEKKEQEHMSDIFSDFFKGDQND